MVDRDDAGAHDRIVYPVDADASSSIGRDDCGERDLGGSVPLDTHLLYHHRFCVSDA